ncbi:MAG TPA: glycosyltransferase [Bacteroidales bacterium]|nr:glycosyltransferase [Bacteroidales bacterium]
MKDVFIISTGEIVNSKTAGARRMVNIASSLAALNVNVFLCSLSEVYQTPVEIQEIKHGVYCMRSLSHTDRAGRNPLRFARTVNSFMAQRNSEIVVYLYPTVFVLKDFFYLVYFKYLKRRRFFCEINELRAASAFSGTPPGRPLAWLLYWLKSSVDYLVYKLNEFQVLLYDGIVVISTSLEGYFSNYARKILKVPILCDSDLINVLTPPRLDPNSPFKICFAGYIKCEKEGFDILFEAFFRVNQDYRTELFLYGILEDTDRNTLEKLSDEYCLRDNVFYMGNIAPEKLQDEFRKYNLLILPRPLKNRTKYGFSTKLSEYLVSGIPVLVTDVSDNALYIRDGFNGYIISPGSASAMADKILEIIRDYNWQAEIVIKNAHQTAREKFDYRLFSHDYVNFFWSQNKITEIEK